MNSGEDQSSGNFVPSSVAKPDSIYLCLPYVCYRSMAESRTDRRSPRAVRVIPGEDKEPGEGLVGGREPEGR